MKDWRTYRQVAAQPGARATLVHTVQLQMVTEGKPLLAIKTKVWKMDRADTERYSTALILGQIHLW